MKSLIVLIILLLRMMTGFSQIENSSKSDTSLIGFEGGIGPSSLFIGVGFSGWYEKNHTVFQLNMYSSENLAIFSPVIAMNELNFSVGKSFTTKYLRFTATTGIAVVQGQNVVDTISGTGWFDDTYIYKKYQTIGLPLQAGAWFYPFKYLGIGLKAYGNINPRVSYSGLLVSLAVGRLKQ